MNRKLYNPIWNMKNYFLLLLLNENVNSNIIMSDDIDVHFSLLWMVWMLVWIRNKAPWNIVLLYIDFCASHSYYCAVLCSERMKERKKERERKRDREKIVTLVLYFYFFFSLFRSVSICPTLSLMLFPVKCFWKAVSSSMFSIWEANNKSQRYLH